MALSWKDLGVSLLLNCGVAFGVFILFGYLRRLQFLRCFYAAKRNLSIPFRFRPPRLSMAFGTWMKPVLTLSDEKFVRCAGMDAFVYQSFLHLCFRLSIYITGLTFITVLPTNYSGSFVDQQISRQIAQGIDAEKCKPPSGDIAQLQQVDAASGVNAAAKDPCTTTSFAFLVSSFDKTALTNIENGSSKMWVHLIVTWLVACLTMKMLWAHYQNMLKWRILYLSWERKGDVSHTVLVQDIPGTPQGPIIGRIYDHIDGTVGLLLPRAFMKKVERAMIEGVASVFQPLKETSDKLYGNCTLFIDNYDVYWRGCEASHEIHNRGAARFFDDTAHHAATSASPQVLDGPVRQPCGRKGSDAATGSAQQIHCSETGNMLSPVSRRLALVNFESRRPNTDFDTWRQAERALQRGLSVEELVKREFKRTFGDDEVEVVRTVKNESHLASLCQRYKRKKVEIEDLTDRWTTMLRRRKAIKRKTVSVRPARHGPAAEARFGEQKVKIDEMEWRVFELDQLLATIKAQQITAREMETSAAFVTFRRRLHATVATGLISYDETAWCTSQAPKPHDLLWHNLPLRHWERSLRNLLHWAIVGLFILFFIPIVAALQSVMNIQAYAETPPDSNWANWIMTQPFLSSILKSILPTLALKICLALTPIAIRLLSRVLTCAYSLSRIDFEVGTKYFVFQFYVVFIMNTIAGTALQGGSGGGGGNATIELFKELAQNPTKIAKWLGASLPQQASFFMMWILTNGLFARGIRFLKLPGAAVFFLLQSLAGTQRQKKRAYSQQYMNYGDDVADHTLTVLMLLVFSTVQPFLPLACALYFAVAYGYARYDLLYTLREQYQSGGLFWQVVFDQIHFGLMVFVLGTMALLGIKQFFTGTILLAPLLVIAIIFRASVRSTLERPMQRLSMHAAADLDRADQAFDWLRDLTPSEEAEMKRLSWDVEQADLGPVHDRYTQPSLLIDQVAHDKAIAEAERVSNSEKQSWEASEDVVLSELSESDNSHLHHASASSR